MTRRAYNRVILPDGTVLHQQVVVMDEQGKLIHHHDLTVEEPFTEWIGGTLDLSQQTCAE